MTPIITSWIPMSHFIGTYGAQILDLTRTMRQYHVGMIYYTPPITALLPVTPKPGGGYGRMSHASHAGG